MVKILLWDIDGTLLAAGGAGGIAMDMAFQELYGRCPSRENIHFSGLTDYHITGQLLRACNLEDSHKAIRSTLQCYEQHFEEAYSRTDARLYPGVTELLEAIEDRGDCMQGLLTGNIEKAGWAKVRRFGLDRFFSFGAFGDDTPERLDVAQAALAKGRETLGDSTDAQSVFVIGDTDNDVRVGQAIGACTIAVETGLRSRILLESVSPDYRFSDLSNTSDFLGILERANGR